MAKFLVPELDKFLFHMTGLLETKGYTVLGFNVTQQRARTFVRFRLTPAPPGRGRDRWEWVSCHEDDPGAQPHYRWDNVKQQSTLLGWRKRWHAESGFRSSEYANTTPRLSPSKLLEYINNLPWLTVKDVRG
jgi:hypothetical protein